MAKNIPLGEITGTMHCEACDHDITLKVDDAGEATCSNCGISFGPYAEIKAKFMRDATAMARQAFRRR